MKPKPIVDSSGNSQRRSCCLVEIGGPLAALMPPPSLQILFLGSEFAFSTLFVMGFLGIERKGWRLRDLRRERDSGPPTPCVQFRLEGRRGEDGSRYGLAFSLVSSGNCAVYCSSSNNSSPLHPSRENKIYPKCVHYMCVFDACSSAMCVVYSSNLTFFNFGACTTHTERGALESVWFTRRV